MTKTTPPAPTASAVGPCPSIQIVGRPGTGSLPSTITPPDHPYFCGYKTKVFSFQNYPKNLDPFHKTYLVLWDYFRLGKTRESHVIVKIHRTDLVTCSHSREGQIPSRQFR